MPALLIQLLISIAQSYPQLSEDIEALRKRGGISDEKWAETKEKLTKDAASYFGKAAAPPAPAVSMYDHWLSSDPTDTGLKPGDYVYAKRLMPSETGALGAWQWWVNAGGPIAFGFPGSPQQENLVRIVK